MYAEHPRTERDIRATSETFTAFRKRSRFTSTPQPLSSAKSIWLGLTNKYCTLSGNDLDRIGERRILALERLQKSGVLQPVGLRAAMFLRTLLLLGAPGILACAPLFAQSRAQQQPPSSVVVPALEFPLLLQQNVIAGKTPVGTKIQAKLLAATLVEGTVIPRNAVFSGEVVESIAMTPTVPSLLALRMNSVQWKNGALNVALYLTRWYYPTMTEAGQNLQYGPTLPANRTWNGEGQYPDPNSKVYKPFPGSDSNKDESVPDTPVSIISDRRVMMKNTDSAHRGDILAIISTHSNLKLDRLTAYVFAPRDLAPQAKK